MFDFTARNFTGALCDPDNLPVTKFSAKNSLYEIIDKEIITSEMIQELIKQTQNTETRIILRDDNQKVKTLSQPLTSFCFLFLNQTRFNPMGKIDVYFTLFATKNSETLQNQLYTHIFIVIIIQKKLTNLKYSCHMNY